MTDPRKPIFDAVRAAARPGLFNDPGNVLALDNLLDAFDVPRLQNTAPRKVSQAGIDLIHSFEGLARVRPDGRIEAYPDPATGGEPWTIGWGSTGTDPFNGGRIRRGTIWTRAQADERFKQHLAQFERDVAAMITAPTTQGQFDALVSLAYNTGSANLRGSTLLRHHNSRRYADAANEFGRWVFAGGKRMNGLVRRREAERKLYLP